jgi:hypothetical protein
MSQTMPRQRLHAPPVASKHDDEEYVKAWRKDLMRGLATTEQLRQILGYVNIRSIYDLCDLGLPWVQLGRKRLFDREAVREWVYTRQSKPRPRSPGRPKGSKNRPKT